MKSVRVLWICNLILPEIAEQLGMNYLPKEGWVAGLLDGILSSPEEERPEMILAFPVGENADGCSGEVSLKAHPGVKVKYYGFYEDTVNPDQYHIKYEESMRKILEEFHPDVVHCFGSEYPHTLAMAKALQDPGKLLISIQGPISIYAERYMAQLPEKVQKCRTFRDILRRDSIRQQQDKYTARGKYEQEAIAGAGHIAGRTEFDRQLTEQWNPKAVYHHAGESLRSVFYEGRWDPAKAQPHRIFVSQADYPLKGFHYLLIAAGRLAQDYPDLEIYAAGQSVIGYETWKEKVKLPAYGKYLRELIRENGLEDRVHMLGRISALQMKDEYLACNTYVCCSACENSPNSLGEAMILGVPCVAAAVGGVTSIFDEEDGYLYRNEPEDSLEQVSKALEMAIRDAWEHPEETERRTNLAAFHGKRNHDRENNTRELLEIYGEMTK